MEVREEGDYIPIGYTVTSRMTPALRRTAMRAILMFHSIARDKVTRQCPQITTFLKRTESRSGGIELRPFCLPLGECLFAEHTSDTSTNYDSFLN